MDDVCVEYVIRLSVESRVVDEIAVGGRISHLSFIEREMGDAHHVIRHGERIA